MAADNSSDAYKKALKQIEDMIKKQEALNKSSDKIKDSWSAISSELFKINGAEFFEKVKNTPADMQRIGKQVSEMQGEFDKLSKAAGNALNKNKEAEQFKKSIQNAYLNAKKVAQEYSDGFQKNLNEEFKKIQLQNDELSKIVKSEKDLEDILKGKKKLNEEQEKHVKGLKEWYKTQENHMKAEENFSKYANGILDSNIKKNEALAAFSPEIVKNIVEQIASGKEYNEIYAETNDMGRMFLATLGKSDEALNDITSTTQNLNKSIEETAKSAGELKEKFNFSKGIEAAAKSLRGQFLSSITKFDDVLHDVQKSTGIMMDSFSNAKAFGELTTKASQFGVSVEQAGEMMSSLSKELNTTNFGVLSKASEDFLAIEGATGAASGDITTIAGEMMRMGASSSQVKDSMGEADKMARQFGVSSSKVIAGISRNIKKMREMGFTGGEKSLAKMAITAERLKMNMDETFDMAKRARSIEGAMDMAAELQLAGGSFSNINPMDLLAAARKGPEELQKILTKMGSDIGKFDEKTGEFKFDPVDVDRLQMVSDATGQSMESLQNMIKTNAEDAKKLDPFSGMLDGLDAADQELAKSGLSQMLKVGEGGKIELDASSDMAKKMGVDSMEELQAMSGQDLKKKMEEDQKTLEEQNKRNQSLSKSWDNFINGLMSLGSILQPVLEGLTWFIQSMTSIFQEIASWGDGFGRYLLGGLMAAFLLFGTSVGTFITQGIGSFAKSVMSFGKSAIDMVKDVAGGGGGIGAAIKDKIMGGGKGPVEGAMKAGGDIASDKSMTPEAGEAKKGFLKGLAEGIQEFGKVKPSDLLKFAASLLIIGGAIIGFGIAMVKVGGEAGIGQMVTAAVSLAMLMGSIWLLSKMASKVDMGGVLKGALAMLVVGASLIPFAFAAQMLTGIDWMSVLAGIGVLALVVLGLMGLGMLMAGPQILFLLIGVGILIAVGAALLVAAAGLLLSATAFQQLGAIDWGAFSEMGGALMSVIPGMLGFSLAAMAFANPISLIGLMFMAMALGGLVTVMAPLAESLTLGADSLDRFAAGLEKLSAAADKLSLEKLEKLKELSDSMASASAGGAIASAMASMANSAGGGNGGGKDNNEPRKLEIAIKLNGRDVQAQIVKDSAIIK
jgi:hypothetical protein